MTISLPNMLSFERKLESSDALMFSGKWSNIDNSEEWQPIAITPRLNRSTQSAEGISDIDKTKPNPVAASNDDANLPLDCDTLKVTFTLRIIGELGKPFACNQPKFEDAIIDKVNAFKESAMMEELAYRYAYNIANGRFLWRNRLGAEEVIVDVGFEKKFNAYDFSLSDFEKNRDDDNLKKLTDKIKRGLLDENNFTLIKITAYVKLGEGQHVFPSQEMNMGEKRKALFKINNQAAMHNVKIGNALRTIDTWYGDNILVRKDKKATEVISIKNQLKVPVAIDPYGSVTQSGRAYRHTGTDLYTLMLGWINDKGDIADENKAFVVANLVRGGVFSKGGGD